MHRDFHYLYTTFYFTKKIIFFSSDEWSENSSKHSVLWPQPHGRHWYPSPDQMSRVQPVEDSDNPYALHVNPALYRNNPTQQAPVSNKRLKVIISYTTQINLNLFHDMYIYIHTHINIYILRWHWHPWEKIFIFISSVKL